MSGDRPLLSVRGGTCRPAHSRPCSSLRMLFGSLLVAATTANCTVGPDYKPPETRVPDRWGESAGGIATTRPADVVDWWTVFGDPTLDKLIERGIEANLDVRIAEARFREARDLRAVAAADLMPQMGVFSSYAYEGRSRNRRPPEPSDSAGDRLRDRVIDQAVDDVADGSLDPAGLATDVVAETLSDKLTGANKQKERPRSQNLFEIGFDASWEIDVFGGLRRSVEAADADVEALREEYHDFLVIVLSEVALNYVQGRGYQEQIAIARENIEIQQETLRLSRSQYDGGYGTELDVAQAQAQLSYTRSKLSTLRTCFRQAVNRVSLLLAEFPSETLADLGDESAIPAPPPEIPLGLPADLLRRRPDIRRHERQLAASTARIGVATADLFPKFALEGSFGTETYDFQRLLDGRSLGWSIGPVVEWPIFDGGRIRANISMYEAIQERELAQYERAVLTAINEVDDALIAYENERERYQNLLDAVEAGRRALSLARIQYEEGVSDFLTVVDSQRSLYKSQEELVESRMNTALHVIAVFKALGGGWETKAEPDGTGPRVAEESGGQNQPSTAALP